MGDVSVRAGEPHNLRGEIEQVVEPGPGGGGPALELGGDNRDGEE